MCYILEFRARKIPLRANIFCDSSRAFNTQFVNMSWKGKDIKDDAFYLPRKYVTSKIRRFFGTKRMKHLMVGKYKAQNIHIHNLPSIQYVMLQ